MADRVDFIDDLIEYNQRTYPRQRVLRIAPESLHPLDNYDMMLTSCQPARQHHENHRNASVKQTAQHTAPSVRCPALRKAVHSNHPCW